MIAIADLWLPIVLAAVLVFIASSLVHMVLQIHKNDYLKLPSEDAVLAALRQANVQPGQYMFPCPASMKDMGTPEMIEKFQRGPVGNVIVRASGVPGIGKSLGQWFVFCLVVGLFTAYVAGLAFGAGTEGMLVFRFTATVAFMGYALETVCQSIWKGVSWSSTAKFLLDGLIYGLITGATFAWLWPAAL